MRQKKALFFTLILTLFFSFSLTSHGWQGRMAGMEDPYGLVGDEYDYLIHVAKIAEGKGFNFYGGYRFTYTNVDKYETRISSAPYGFNFSGEEFKHDALIGSSFALGPGRMGIFFSYQGVRGDFDTGLLPTEGSSFVGLKNKDNLDDFSLRVMYGIPVGGFALGAETGVAYWQEKNSLLIYNDEGEGYINFHLIEGYQMNLSLPPFPAYDSAYWEIPLKVGLSGKMGPLDTQFTLRGGFIVGGDNTLTFGAYEPGDSAYDDLDGDTKGWSVGGDLWLRYHLGNGLSLPFIVSADYRDKKRKARGTLWNLDPDIYLDCKNKETSFNLTLGGGVDKAIGQQTRLAAGIYYSYLNSNKDMRLTVFDEGDYDGEVFFDDFPSSSEHRATLRLAGEHALSPVVALRGGLGFFYGLVTQDTVFGFRDATETKVKLAADGYRWGAGASFGASIKLTPVTLEPFLNAGYQYMKLTADIYEDGSLIPGADRKDKRNQWYVGGGLAVKFGQ
ncbi:MAG TPA: autotransporter outer membrane beta-barrel domain-containing protein [Smithellaceae bacterium]|nr:autotransporter outer membrane beta-barrel domain-containing protein [Smithellaceae bacterium]HRS89504.1 autotransporter outer membrane beta-barrel domain-containing protein [Smithellaceae bacterium]HRV26453.1 autotransporter outer membrane beta-barrel domain-containing protein [Smithellaceae bacterium]